MTTDREATVLFAEVADSTRLYEDAGDSTAADAIRRCIEVMRGATKESGGRVVKTIGDGVMALFPSPDRATQAAARMHIAVSALPAVGGEKLALRIGFHAGPILQRDGDIFGDTVNIASRLAAQATRGQVLTSADSATKLSPVLRSATRHLYDIAVKGKADDIALCEVLWSKSPDVTDIPLGHAPQAATTARLRLRVGNREVMRRRGAESISIGRDPESTIVIADTAASRHHCVIERRQNHFVIRDQSSNGTFVLVDGDKDDTILRREEFVLRGHGWIAFGRANSEAAEVAEYFCDDDILSEADDD